MKYIFVAIVLLGLAAIMPVMGEQQSVKISGHAFTADLPEGWVVSDDTVAVIHVSANKKHTSGAEDTKLFDGRAWDVINSITLT